VLGTCFAHFLSGRSERKCEGFSLALARGEMHPAFLGVVVGRIFIPSGEGERQGEEIEMTEKGELLLIFCIIIIIFITVFI